MALDTRAERVVYQGLIPVLGAVLGAIAATWYQSASMDSAQIGDITALLRDPQLNSQQKIQALEMYKEITDRPWYVIRSLTTSFTICVAMVLAALNAGGWFSKT